MAELGATINAILDPIVAKAREVAAQPDHPNWCAGFRGSYNHDVQRSENADLKVALAPGLPIPVSVGLDAGFSQQAHDTTNLQVYFLFSSQQAPTVDPSPGVPVPTVPINLPPLVPGDPSA